MRRLLHYELKEHYLPLVVLGAVFALCVFGCVGFSELDIAAVASPTLHNLLDVAFGLCVIGAFSAVFLLVVAHIFLIISTFGKSLFGDYGYLLFCLPLGIDTILLAKVLSCFILIGASVCFYGFIGVQALILVADFDILTILGQIGMLVREIFATFGERSIFIVLLSTTYILGEILTWLMYILLTLTLLNVWHITSYRLVLGLLLFLGICLCGSVISTLLGLLFGIFFPININSLAIITQSKVGIDSWLLYVQKLITYLLLSGVSYLLARHCIIKKMELE